MVEGPLVGVVGEDRLEGSSQQYQFLLGFMRGLSFREEFASPVLDSKADLWYFPGLARWSNPIVTISCDEVATFQLIGLRHQIQRLVGRALVMGEESVLLTRQGSELHSFLTQMLPMD